MKLIKIILLFSISKNLQYSNNFLLTFSFFDNKNAIEIFTTIQLDLKLSTVVSFTVLVFPI